MNLWHTNDAATVWKRIRVHHVMAAAGAALAVSAMLVLASQDAEGPALRDPEGPGIRAPSTAAARDEGRDVHVVYFVVGTPAQALAIEAGANELLQDGQHWSTHFAVLPAHTPAGWVAAEHLTTRGVEELGRPGVATVVDLR
jgi:hypothetical protein